MIIGRLSFKEMATAVEALKCEMKEQSWREQIP